MPRSPRNRKRHKKHKKSSKNRTRAPHEIHVQITPNAQSPNKNTIANFRASLSIINKKFQKEWDNLWGSKVTSMKLQEKQKDPKFTMAFLLQTLDPRLISVYFEILTASPTKRPTQFSTELRKNVYNGILEWLAPLQPSMVKIIFGYRKYENIWKFCLHHIAFVEFLFSLSLSMSHSKKCSGTCDELYITI